jgi:hypothetical protein
VKLRRWRGTDTTVVVRDVSTADALRRFRRHLGNVPPPPAFYRVALAATA